MKQQDLGLLMLLICPQGGRHTSIIRAFDERQALHLLGMSTAYATEAAFVKELGKLETADIARATGADKTSVRAWVRGNRSPSGIYGERLAELSALVERLAHVLQRDFIRGWLIKPNVALDDGKPLDVIAAGDYRKVSKIISGLESTAVS